MVAGLVSFAQHQGIREKQCTLTGDTILIDSLPLIPEYVALRDSNGQAISKNLYKIENGSLFFSLNNTPNLKGQRITCRYRVLAFPITMPIVSKKPTADSVLAKEDIAPGNFIYDPSAVTISPSELKGLDYSGSFSRGLSFGNSQNLVLNSAFNLQLSGMLGDDIEVNAAITDQNIPIQPEGNTASLQDFDRIFITLKKQKSELTAGDYELAVPKGAYFLNYLKKLKGASLSTGYDAKEFGQIQGRAAYAIARGKFARNQFQGTEGNQGPYRLSGAEGEVFIIVLSGTERVFIDGVLMQRGLDKDYIIDYNVGEVKFTANRLITKDSRIQIEFGYQDQNYVRSLWAADAKWQLGKLALRFNAYSEQDNKNQVATGNLTEQDILMLEVAGDDPNRALVRRIDSLDQFNPQRILYELRDSVVNGVRYDSVLVYSTNPLKAKYLGNFTHLGQGNGNYRIAVSNANGRVYEWIPPKADGTLQGSFEPAKNLVTPKQNQLFSLGGTWAIGKKFEVDIEAALSNQDLNLFSSLDADDNKGVATKLSLKGFSPMAFKADSSSIWHGARLQYHAHYEFVQDNFRFIEPFRQREFTRDWNTIGKTAQLNEHLARAGLSFSSKIGGLGFESSALIQDTAYQGFKQSAFANFALKGWDVKANVSLLSNQTVRESAVFVRPKIDLSKTFSKAHDLKIGLYWEREENTLRDRNADTLRASAFRFDILKASLGSMETEGRDYFWNASFQRRYDFRPASEAFRQLTLADEWSVNGGLNSKSAGQLRANFTYRTLETDSLYSEVKSQDTYLGRLDYQLGLLKNSLRISTVYEAGSGQQRRAEYNYLRVNAGEGSYQWIDRNQDSIPQLNEFELAVFSDLANYMRVVSYTDDFVRTNNVVFNQSIQFNGKQLWGSSKQKVGKFLSRFSTQSVFNIDRRSYQSPLVSAFNPFELGISDSLLVSFTSTIRNSLFFNRNHPKYSIELSQLANSNRQNIASGAESRLVSQWQFSGRWNITSDLSLKLQAATNSNERQAQNFADRNFNLLGYDLSPEVAWFWKKKFRATFTYKLQLSDNQIGDKESKVSHNLGLEMAYNKSTKTDIRAKFNLVENIYTGNTSTPVAFAMLEGLQTGQNLLWSLTWRQSLGGSIELNISYEGRKTGTQASVVHVGRMQIRAAF